MRSKGRCWPRGRNPGYLLSEFWGPMHGAAIQLRDRVMYFGAAKKVDLKCFHRRKGNDVT